MLKASKEPKRHDAGCRHCAAVRAERDTLAERVRQLENLIYDDEWVPGQWLLTPRERLVLKLLALRGSATREQIEAALDDQGGTALVANRCEPDRVAPINTNVHIYKLRKKLAAANVPVSIESEWGVGYVIDAAGRLFLTQLMKAVA